MIKKLISLFSVVLLCTGFCVASDPVEGFWISYDEKTGKATAGWKIWEENGFLFGTILSLAGFPQDVKAYGTKGKGPYRDFPVSGDMAGMMTVGTPWIYNLKKISEGVWAKGMIVDPNDGNKYKCRITFHQANRNKYNKPTLEMRGEIGLGIGRSQFWIAATEEEAAGLR
jgi:uncharacterized protein (DUF2147 family)